MKLKEKLAEEFCSGVDNNKYVEMQMFNAYLAGFEKARAMAIEYFLSCPDKLRGIPIEYSVNAIIPGELRQLGEEECK